jgi:hypothetical protein
MKTKLTLIAAALSLVVVAACDTRAGDETAREVDAADTIVTAEQRVDTTIVTRDTTVEVDTIRREADRPTRRDTLQRRGTSGAAPTPSTPAPAPVDTGDTTP